MIRLYAIILVLLTLQVSTIDVRAQAPDTVWEHCYGGVYQDQAQSARPTPDGGCIVLGSTSCNDHDVSGNHGGVDYWVLKLDRYGKISWQKCLGGFDDDYGWGDIEVTADTGYILCGFSYSKDSTGSQVTGNHGAADYWVVKLDINGNITWEKSLGGSGDDAAYSIRQVKDGGYIVAGATVSNDKQVGFNHGLIDAWIVKLSATGNIQWKHSYGGTGYDAANSIVQTVDGGYVFAGYTTSSDSDLDGRPLAYTSNTDLWVMRLDSVGNKIWSKWYGGSGEEEANAIQQTSDGGFIVTGYTSSNNRDVSGYHDSTDCWLLRLNANGTIRWQKCLGGSGRDTANDVALSGDNGFLVAGFTTSNDYDVKGNHGNKDMWVVKTDSSGKPVWQKCLGGSRSDGAFSIANNGDSTLILTGWSYTENDGDVHGHHNLSFPPNYDIDVWVVKLGYKTYIPEPYEAMDINLYPNPAHNLIAISSLSKKPLESLTVYTLLGQSVIYIPSVYSPYFLNVSNLQPGFYITEFIQDGRLYRKKIIIQ